MSEIRTADGEALLKLRNLLRLTQERLASELEISVQLERSLEGGKLPLSAAVRQRVFDLYGVRVEGGQLLDETGQPYSAEVFDRRCSTAAAAVGGEHLWQAVQRDLLLLLNAAREERKLYVLLPRLRRFLVQAREQVQLSEAVEALRSRTVTAGEIRANERSQPLQRRLRRLLAREDAQLQLPEEKQDAGQLAQVRTKIAETQRQIAAVRSRTQVSGRRKTIHRVLNGQTVTVKPNDRNDKTFTVSSPAFAAWWDSYRLALSDAAGQHGPEDA